jgi:hypothetical protein
MANVIVTKDLLKLFEGLDPVPINVKTLKILENFFDQFEKHGEQTKSLRRNVLHKFNKNKKISMKEEKIFQNKLLELKKNTEKIEEENKNLTIKLNEMNKEHEEKRKQDAEKAKQEQNNNLTVDPTEDEAIDDANKKQEEIKQKVIDTEKEKKNIDNEQIKNNKELQILEKKISDKKEMQKEKEYKIQKAIDDVGQEGKKEGNNYEPKYVIQKKTPDDANKKQGDAALQIQKMMRGNVDRRKVDKMKKEKEEKKKEIEEERRRQLLADAAEKKQKEKEKAAEDAAEDVAALSKQEIDNKNYKKIIEWATGDDKDLNKIPEKEKIGENIVSKKEYNIVLDLLQKLSANLNVFYKASDLDKDGDYHNDNQDNCSVEPLKRTINEQIILRNKNIEPTTYIYYLFRAIETILLFYYVDLKINNLHREQSYLNMNMLTYTEKEFIKKNLIDFYFETKNNKKIKLKNCLYNLPLNPNKIKDIEDGMDQTFLEKIFKKIRNLKNFKIFSRNVLKCHHIVLRTAEVFLKISDIAYCKKEGIEMFGDKVINEQNIEQKKNKVKHSIIYEKVLNDLQKVANGGQKGGDIDFSDRLFTVKGVENSGTTDTNEILRITNTRNYLLYGCREYNNFGDKIIPIKNGVSPFESEDKAWFNKYYYFGPYSHVFSINDSNDYINKIICYNMMQNLIDGRDVIYLTYGFSGTGKTFTTGLILGYLFKYIIENKEMFNLTSIDMKFKEITHPSVKENELLCSGYNKNGIFYDSKDEKDPPNESFVFVKENEDVCVLGDDNGNKVSFDILKKYIYPLYKNKLKKLTNENKQSIERKYIGNEEAKDGIYYTATGMGSGGLKENLTKALDFKYFDKFFTLEKDGPARKFSYDPQYLDIINETDFKMLNHESANESINENKKFYILDDYNEEDNNNNPKFLHYKKKAIAYITKQIKNNNVDEPMYFIQNGFYQKVRFKNFEGNKDLNRFNEKLQKESDESINKRMKKLKVDTFNKKIIANDFKFYKSAPMWEIKLQKILMLLDDKIKENDFKTQKTGNLLEYLEFLRTHIESKEPYNKLKKTLKDLFKKHSYFKYENLQNKLEEVKKHDWTTNVLNFNDKGGNILKKQLENNGKLYLVEITDRQRGLYYGTFIKDDMGKKSGLLNMKGDRKGLKLTDYVYDNENFIKLRPKPNKERNTISKYINIWTNKEHGSGTFNETINRITEIFDPKTKEEITGDTVAYGGRGAPINYFIQNNESFNETSNYEISAMSKYIDTSLPAKIIEEIKKHIKTQGAFITAYENSLIIRCSKNASDLSETDVEKYKFINYVINNIKIYFIPSDFYKYSKKWGGKGWNDEEGEINALLGKPLMENVQYLFLLKKQIDIDLLIRNEKPTEQELKNYSKQEGKKIIEAYKNISRNYDLKLHFVKIKFSLYYRQLRTLYRKGGQSWNFDRFPSSTDAIPITIYKNGIEIKQAIRRVTHFLTILDEMGYKNYTTNNPESSRSHKFVIFNFTMGSKPVKILLNDLAGIENFIWKDDQTEEGLIFKFRNNSNYALRWYQIFLSLVVDFLTSKLQRYIKMVEAIGNSDDTTKTNYKIIIEKIDSFFQILFGEKTWTRNQNEIISNKKVREDHIDKIKKIGEPLKESLLKLVKIFMYDLCQKIGALHTDSNREDTIVFEDFDFRMDIPIPRQWWEPINDNKTIDVKTIYDKLFDNIEPPAHPIHKLFPKDFINDSGFKKDNFSLSVGTFKTELNYDIVLESPICSLFIIKMKVDEKNNTIYDREIYDEWVIKTHENYLHNVQHTGGWINSNLSKLKNHFGDSDKSQRINTLKTFLNRDEDMNDFENINITPLFSPYSMPPLINLNEIVNGKTKIDYKFKFNCGDVHIKNTKELLDNYKNEGGKLLIDSQKGPMEKYQNDLINFYQDNIPNFSNSCISILLTSTNIDKNLAINVKVEETNEEKKVVKVEETNEEKKVVKVEVSAPLGVYNLIQQICSPFYDNNDDIVPYIKTNIYNRRHIINGYWDTYRLSEEEEDIYNNNLGLIQVFNSYNPYYQQQMGAKHIGKDDVKFFTNDGWIKAKKRMKNKAVAWGKNENQFGNLLKYDFYSNDKELLNNIKMDNESETLGTNINNPENNVWIISSDAKVFNYDDKGNEINIPLVPIYKKNIQTQCDNARKNKDFTYYNDYIDSISATHQGGRKKKTRRRRNKFTKKEKRKIKKKTRRRRKRKTKKK